MSVVLGRDFAVVAPGQNNAWVRRSNALCVEPDVWAAFGGNKGFGSKE